VRAKHKGGTRANPDDWIMKVKNFFRASRGRIGATRLYALASPYASYGPAQYRHPPFNIPRSTPAACRPRLPLTQQSWRMLDNFPPDCPPLQKKLCTALTIISNLEWNGDFPMNLRTQNGNGICQQVFATRNGKGNLPISFSIPNGMGIFP